MKANARVSGSISRTINIGNFESVRIQVGLEFDIIEGTIKENQKKLYGLCEKELDRRCKSIEGNGD